MTLSIARLVRPTNLNVVKKVDVPQESVRHLMEAPDDPSLVERVECALRSTGYEALRIVAISIGDRLVILLGRVPSYYLKQIAQTAALKVSGVHGVRNDLDVTRVH